MFTLYQVKPSLSPLRRLKQLSHSSILIGGVHDVEPIGMFNPHILMKHLLSRSVSLGSFAVIPLSPVLVLGGGGAHAYYSPWPFGFVTLCRCLGDLFLHGPTVSECPSGAGLVTWAAQLCQLDVLVSLILLLWMNRRNLEIRVFLELLTLEVTNKVTNTRSSPV